MAKEKKGFGTHLCLTVDKKRAEISLKRTVSVTYWDSRSTTVTLSNGIPIETRLKTALPYKALHHANLDSDKKKY